MLSSAVASLFVDAAEDDDRRRVLEFPVVVFFPGVVEAEVDALLEAATKNLSRLCEHKVS